MHNYELVLILSPEIADENVSASVARVSQFITDRGGLVTEVEQWGRRKIAYPIRRFTEGTYVLAHCQMETKTTSDLEASLHLNEEVLRHLLVRVDSKSDS